MKKLVSLLLALILAVGLLPTTVLADDTPHTHCVCGQAAADAHTAPYLAHNDTVSWTAWTESGALPDADGYYYLTQDVTLTQPWAEEVDVKLCLNGHQIIGPDGADAIIAVPGAKLGVTDCAGGGQITHAQGTSGRGVTVQKKIPGAKSGGVFTLYAGSITGNSAENGGGVYVEDHLHDATGIFSAELYLYGGSITNNTASQNGGGVYAKSHFYLHGGSITGNTAGDLGGGVYLYPDPLQILNVSGTVNVTGNTSADGAASNLHLDAQAITNADALNTSSRIGVRTAKKPDGYRVFPSVTFSGGEDQLACFLLDDPTAGVVKYLGSSSPRRCILWDNSKRFVGNEDEQYYTLYEAMAAANDGDTLTVLTGHFSSSDPTDATLYYDEAECRAIALDEYNSNHVLIDKDITLDCGDIRVDAPGLEVSEGKTLTLKGASGGLEKDIAIAAGQVVVESGDHAGVELAAYQDGVGSGALVVKDGRLEVAGVFAGEMSITGGRVDTLYAVEGSLSLTGGELGMLVFSPGPTSLSSSRPMKM